jgi:NO-binding membrane sensor protein with MHYT domain
MLAVILPVELRYEMVQTVSSAVLAVIFTSIAFSIVGRNRLGRYTLPVSAVFLGLGIGGMHYLGMNAVRGNCTLAYSWLGVVVSIVIAVQASAVALWFAFRERGLFDTILGAVALGLAIASMHYTAMEATRFLPGQGFAGFLGHAFSERYLALSISIAMYGICGMCITVFSVLTFVKRPSPQGDRRIAP